MKITIVLGAFFPVPPIMGGAVEKAWFALGQEFSRRGHEVVQISRALPQFVPRETIEGVQHIRVHGYDAPGSLFWLKALDLLYSFRAKRVLPASDVIVTNTFWLPMLLRGARRRVLYVHVARYPKGQMRFYRHGARLQAPSHAVARAIVAEVPALEPRVTVIPYPRPNSNAGGLPEFSAREQKIIYVGRLHPEKGVHLLIRALTSGSQSFFTGWKLGVIGSAEEKFGGGGQSYLEELKDSARSTAGQVEFRGPIFETDRLEQEFRSARLFVYPSLAEEGETFGLAPLEAMARGCPVLVSDLACFRDFVQDGVTGFTFDHRTPDPTQSLQTRMQQILDDEALLTRVAQAGSKKSEEYTLPRVADQFLRDFATLQV